MSTTASVSVYWMIYSTSGAVHATAVPAGTWAVKLAFIFGSPMQFAGPSPFGQSTMNSELATLQAAGTKIIGSIGGSGNTVDLSNASSFVSQWASLNSTLGLTMDGIDIDLEYNFDSTQLVAVLRALRSAYGPNFAITWAPNGSNIDTYLSIVTSNLDLCTDFGQQFYDAPIDWPTIKSRIEQALAAGIPPAKYSLGFMIGANPNYETVSDCTTYMTNAQAYGISRAFWWELSRNSNSMPNETVTAMSNIIALFPGTGSSGAVSATATATTKITASTKVTPNTGVISSFVNATSNIIAFTGTSAPAVVDAQGNVWAFTGSAEVSRKNYRAHGVFGSWEGSTDKTNRDVYFSMQLSGVLRRIGQGTPATSAYYRGMTLNPPGNIIGYWPCEDAVGSQSLAPAIGLYPMQITGTPQLASSSILSCSSAMVTTSSASFTANLAPTAATGQYTIRWLGEITSATTGASVMRMYMSGTGAIWEVAYNDANSYFLNVFDGSGNSLYSSLIGIVWGIPQQFQLDVTQVGQNVLYNFSVVFPNQPVGGTFSDTVNNVTLGSPQSIVFNYNRNSTGIVFGHVILFNQIPSVFTQSQLLAAWSGETATNRYTRLCDEENIACTFHSSGISATMGPQSVDTILNLLRECESADDAIMFDSREFVGLDYRPRGSTSTLAGPVATLDYSAADLSDLKPTYDDLLLKNDITYARKNGSQIRIADKKTNRAVKKIGTYADSLSANLAVDSVLIDHAHWRLHLGTVDEFRYPQITLKMTRSNFFNTALGKTVRDLDVGDMVVINNPPAWLGYDPIRQIVQGFSEKINSTDWDIILNLAPASVYDIGQYDDGGTTRYNTESSVLVNPLNTTDTMFYVATLAGSIWTTKLASFPFDINIDGERMTVTGITSNTSPQIFTVTRSVNGIVKTHNSNAIVSLFRPSYYTLGA